jgi:hypothetical protein
MLRISPSAAALCVYRELHHITLSAPHLIVLSGLFSFRGDALQLSWPRPLPERPPAWPEPSPAHPLLTIGRRGFQGFVLRQRNSCFSAFRPKGFGIISDEVPMGMGIHWSLPCVWESWCQLSGDA